MDFSVKYRLYGYWLWLRFYDGVRFIFLDGKSGQIRDAYTKKIRILLVSRARIWFRKIDFTSRLGLWPGLQCQISTIRILIVIAFPWWSQIHTPCFQAFFGAKKCFHVFKHFLAPKSASMFSSTFWRQNLEINLAPRNLKNVGATCSYHFGVLNEISRLALDPGAASIMW